MKCLGDYGHLDFHWFKWMKVGPAQELNIKLLGLIEVLTSALNNWRKSLSALRTRYYALNLVPSTQFSSLIQELKAGHLHKIKKYLSNLESFTQL